MPQLIRRNYYIVHTPFFFIKTVHVLKRLPFQWLTQLIGYRPLRLIHYWLPIFLPEP